LGPGSTQEVIMSDQAVVDLIQTVIILWLMYDLRLTKREMGQLWDKYVKDKRESDQDKH
jgi:hypothetical protein